MDKLVQLQATLRAIETGKRLEAVDNVLVQQVLHKPRTQSSQTRWEPDAKELYRDLLALKKSKVKTSANLNTNHQDISGLDNIIDIAEQHQSSPPKKLPTKHHHSVTSSHNITNNISKSEELANTSATFALMQKALYIREKELQRSKKAVARADANLRQELNRAEKILPSKFLFERHLASDRSLKAARNVIFRFQHRFFQLYFRHWWMATLALRLQAQRQAMVTIVRVYRGYRSRREAQIIRKQVRLLQAQKCQLLTFRLKYRKSQAMKLQMAWRRYLRRRALKSRQARQAAANLLQKAFRTRQWRNQSLVHALTNSQRLFAALRMQKLYRGYRTRCNLVETKRRKQQEERVQLALLRNMSRPARANSVIERLGAGYLIATHAIFPYALRMRWRRAIYQLRRQFAAKCIARYVCKWFNVEIRREAVRIKQVNEWLAFVQHEHEHSQFAAILIQKHLRRWTQQRQFLMAQARRQKADRKTRLARNNYQLQQRKTPDLIGAKRDEKAIQNEAAKLVQRYFRRFCAKKRARVRFWRIQAAKVEAQMLQRRNAAIEIQRRLRGVLGRTFARQRRAQRLLLRFILRCKWKRVQKRQHASHKIVRWFRHKRAQKLAKLWGIEQKKQLKASFQIQRWYRLHCLLPLRLLQSLRITRKWDETFVFCTQSLQICRQFVADEFVVQSFNASLEEALRPFLSDLTAISRSPLKLKISPTKQRKKRLPSVNFPILQMIFLVVSGWKMPLKWRDLDGKTLLQTKLERTKAVTFFRSLSKRGELVAHQIRSCPVNKTVRSPTRRTHKSPSKGAKTGETFSSVDVDVAMARATAGAKGALDFAAFVRIVGLLGEISLTQQTSSLYWGRYDGSEAHVLALMWFSLLSHSSMKIIALEFETYIKIELSRYASCLQRLFTRQSQKLRGAAMLVEMRRNLRNEELSRATILLQTQARKLLARRELCRKMKKIYEKFLDPTWGLPYWMNPRSGYSTWQKPRLLGAEDVCCEPVPFPSPERTLKAPCKGKKNCENCAEWVCYDCDEYFCLECFSEYHKSKDILLTDLSVDEENDEKKRKNRQHELEKLEICGLCKFQLASRRCLDCVPKKDFKQKFKFSPNEKLGKQKRKLLLENATNGDENISIEALFCDVCFGFLHQRGGLKAHRTEALLELCTSCISNQENDVNEVFYKQFSTKFEIGVADAVQWECEACGDPPRRVCGRCAHQFHPKESCGELHPIPLQTLGRRERSKRLQDEQDARDRADVDKVRARALRARQERSARRLQTFWRSQFPILQAKRLVASRRQEKSELWLRRQEDLRLAKRIAYRTKNALGIAPPLCTDSVVERRLRSLHVLARRQLSIRARCFGLLIDEYVTVGIPLPGLGLLHTGSNEIWTSEDLRGWIHNRQTIRVKKLTKEEAEPAERALCAWRQLEHWGKTTTEFLDPEIEEIDAKTELETLKAKDTSWLMEIHPKQTITESVVPLAQSYDPPQAKKKRRKAGDEEEIEEDVPVAMFLVEFSLDPKRTVWINHSLAERFWEWKRLKLLARSERAGQRQRANDYKKHQQILEDKRKQEEEVNCQETAVDTESFLPEVENLPSFDFVSNVPAAGDQEWSGYDSSWTNAAPVVDPYYNYNYYSSRDQGTVNSTWDGQSPASYDYKSSLNALQTPVMTEATGLVDSGNYYANGDYTGDSNTSAASNWYGNDYSSYDTTTYSPAVTYYNYDAGGNDNNAWASYTNYGSAAEGTNYEPPIDPNAAWYDNIEATENTYNDNNQWLQNGYTEGQPSTIGSYPSDSSFNIDLPTTTDGYYDPQTSSQNYSEPQSEWEEVFDPATQQTYYVNRVTNETAWQVP